MTLIPAPIKKSINCCLTSTRKWIKVDNSQISSLYGAVLRSGFHGCDRRLISVKEPPSRLSTSFYWALQKRGGRRQEKEKEIKLFLVNDVSSFSAQ